MNEISDKLNQARERLQAEAPMPPTASGPAELLVVEDIERITGMKRDWIYGEVRAGRLPHVRLGRYVRFRPESIAAWLESIERGRPRVR